MDRVDSEWTVWLRLCLLHKVGHPTLSAHLDTLRPVDINWEKRDFCPPAPENSGAGAKHQTNNRTVDLHSSLWFGRSINYVRGL